MKVLYENEVKLKLKSLKDEMIGIQGDNKGLKTFKKIVNTVDNLELFSNTGVPIKEKFDLNCPDNWYLLIVGQNYFIYSITDTINILKLYNEKEDFIYDLFGISMRSQESMDYWGD